MDDKNQPIEQQQPFQQGKTIGQVVSKTVPQKTLKEKLKLYLMIFWGSLLVLFGAAFSLIAVSGTETSMLPKLFGMSQSTYINGLSTLVHLVFICVALSIFAFTMKGLFRMFMAKKEDQEAKKKGLKLTIISGIILFLLLISWVFTYVYMDSKRVAVAKFSAPVLTTPEDTINLTGPIEIKFDAANVSVDPGKYSIIFYAWDFGDNATGTGKVVSHNFTQNGRYDVILTVTRRDKTTAEEFKDQYSVTVTIANQTLTASFTANPQSGEAPLKVDFDASTSVDPDATIARYEWDFNNDGDFSDAAGVKTTNTFEKIGIYKVSLRIVSTTGRYNIGNKEIKVDESQNPKPVITIEDEPDHLVAGFNYLFKADGSTSPSGNISKYEWDFGDGTRTEKTKSVSHGFINEGTFEISLKVTDETGKEGELKKTVTVGSPKGTPKAVINSDPIKGDLGIEGKAPLTVKFDASLSTDSDNNIVDYEWVFGDGTSNGVGETVTHVFVNAGTYIVKLSALDADRNVGTTTVAVKVAPAGITAAVTADKIDGTSPLTVSFDASGSTYTKGQITSYRWDFGDKTASKLGAAKITHKYTDVGNYTATVTVIGSDNTTSQATIMITVRETPLTACFIASMSEGAAPLATTFDPSCSTGTISNYSWDFGDGSTATDTKPAHTFNAPGSYTVKLEITDASNTVSKSQLTVTVTQ